MHLHHHAGCVVRTVIHHGFAFLALALAHHIRHHATLPHRISLTHHVSRDGIINAVNTTHVHNKNNIVVLPNLDAFIISSVFHKL